LPAADISPSNSTSLAVQNSIALGTLVSGVTLHTHKTLPL
jgi:hypothetical protein